MAIAQQFGNMLNEALKVSLLKKELEDRMWYYKTVEKDNTWKGGTLPVPFKSASASSIAWGSYTAEDDIAQAQYVRGQVSDYKTAVGSLMFNHRDLR